MKFAEVIVDVPTMQTDQPYSYKIPAELETIIVPGVRVRVPFGKSNRHVQGFVVGVSTKEPAFAYKEIAEAEDFTPVLNQELLALSDYMTESTFAFKITCLQTMLPAALKTTYEQYFLPTKAASEATRERFAKQSALKVADLRATPQWNEWLKLQTQGEIDVQYLPKKRGKIKQERHLICLLSATELQQIKTTLPSNAHRQFALIDLLLTLESNKAYRVAELPLEGYQATLKQAEKKGWIRLEQREVYRTVHAETIPTTQALSLNTEQQLAYEQITQASRKQQETVFLLEGVTGSGKTEVYLQSIADVLKQGQTALMLVPEIALTPQMVTRFKARFGDQVAVLHSGLSVGEKYDEWRRIERCEAKIVVGARSAVFAPLENIGLIILDEEHESSYKQEENPRYHARDIALWRGRYHHCPVVLGSATPSLETRARAHKGRYQLLRLTERAQKQALPKVHLVDMTTEAIKSPNPNFSPALLQAIEQRLQRHEQMVLLLNQRGYSSFMMCRDCGYVVKCPNCDLSLTYHTHPNRLECHYCGHTELVSYQCPNCHQAHLRYFGTGIQKIEEELQQLFPVARIVRMDADTTRRKGSYEKILKQFDQQQADILLGTQMVAKGLDFPNVTLVGVLNADTALNLPDFRASERTFQLLTQVSGRAGRGQKEGEVFVQTYNPSHYAIQLAQKQDYEAFFLHEMQMRHLNLYPPYVYTLRIVISHKEEAKAAKLAQQVAQKIRPLLTKEAIVLGPTPRSIARINQRYFYQIVIKYKNEPQLMTGLHQLLFNMQKLTQRGFHFFVDREPLQFI